VNYPFKINPYCIKWQPHTTGESQQLVFVSLKLRTREPHRDAFAHQYFIYIIHQWLPTKSRQYFFFYQKIFFFTYFFIFFFWWLIK